MHSRSSVTVERALFLPPLFLYLSIVSPPLMNPDLSSQVTEGAS